MKPSKNSKAKKPKNTKKALRFSVRTKMILAMILVTVIVTVCVSLAIYGRVSVSYKDRMAADTLSLTQVSSSTIDGNLMNLLEAGSEKGYANQQMQQALQKIDDHSDLHAIYTIGERDGQYVYLTDMRRATLGEPIDASLTDAVAAAWESDGYVIPDVKHDKNGDYMIAMAPIEGFGGQNVGVLVLENNADCVKASMHEIIRAMGEAGSVMLILSILLSVLIASSITKGLKVVNNKVAELASNDGDLTKKIEIRNNDEVGDIAENINRLLEHIRSVVISISFNSQSLSGSVATALDSTNQTTDRLNSVSGTMETMSAVMEETSASLQQVQSSTSDIKDELTGMHTNLTKGTEFAKAMEARALELRENSEIETANAQQAADDMTAALDEKIEKSKAVEDISKLTQTILEIASQTNLLSLNASIEAARAGEQGRGFAVVAGQIQKLAEQSNESAQQIEAIIDELLSDSQKAVETMTEVEQIMNEQNENVALTEQKFDEVTDGISASIDSIRVIRDKSAELDSTRIEVVDIVQNLTAIAEENAASTEETSASVTEVSAIVNNISEKAQELKAIADELDGNMSNFIV